jgi:hypothetical protein
MRQHDAMARQILTVVRLNPECTVEQVIQELVEFRWCDVFFEVHTLSRLGQLQLTQHSSDLKTTLRALDTGD